MNDNAKPEEAAQWWRPRNGWSWFLIVLLVVDAARFGRRLSEGLLDVFTLIFMVALAWLFLASQGVVGKGRRSTSEKPAQRPPSDHEFRPDSWPHQVGQSSPPHLIEGLS